MSSFPIEQTWLVLVNLLTDLRKNNIDVPTKINEDIRLVRTSINFYKKDPTHPDMMNELKRINDFLNSIQDSLLILAESLGNDYYQEWVDKLMRASRGEEIYASKETKSRFIVGAPPGFSAARVTLKEAIAEDRVQDIAEELNLIIEFEEDEVIALYGDAANVKTGLKEIGSFFRD
ncbi:DUF2096 domain-containing protein [Methanobacterium alcaliphilum]|uniref:DUF2096 domain-containing protein n=1 Tax=Methanobacterium alcaliphilum TaxID=392018 RepID=UPI00200B3DFC|nr:DUF2096 domain-containing protein [Methanobacterium alcaliphilum]MCK9151272.1 DUF2096 domain-containing protein [Methanobacterium alcaliphilum]